MILDLNKFINVYLCNILWLQEDLNKMTEEVTFIDAEFQTSGNQKIDYKNILMKQIDYIRFLRVQDMGENAMFDIGLENLGKSDRFFVWVSNAQKYQNSVKSLKSLLISYNDEDFEKEITKIENRYNKLLRQELIKIKKTCENLKKSEKEYLEQVKIHKRTFFLLNNTEMFDEIFEETLLLARRAKFIGGNDTIEEIA